MPLNLPARGAFRPRFIQPEEIPLFGLPDADNQPNILALIDAASILVDGHCGRTDGNGQGSLVYTTYAERLLFQAAGRNILRVSFKPMVAIDATTVAELQASASAPLPTQFKSQPLLYTNSYWTGCQANTQVRPDGSLTSIIGASGRYGYSRRNSAAVYPDLNYGMNLLMVASYFGGPPGFTPIDVTAIDWDQQTQSGEIWVPAGIWMSQYTEMICVYNAGYDPRNLPPPIKTATSQICRNFLARGGGVGALRSIQGQGMVNYQLMDSDIDPNTDRILEPFKNVIAY